MSDALHFSYSGELSLEGPLSGLIHVLKGIRLANYGIFSKRRGAWLRTHAAQ